MILIGELSLWVALLMAAWATTVSFAGGAQRRDDLIASGERGIYAALVMIVLASLGLWTAIVAHDFSFDFVASFTSANLPLIYTLAAFWGGPAGSLLLWTLVLAVCYATAVVTNRARNRGVMPYVTGTLAVILTTALVALCLGLNPYERIEWAPLDGRGMNPLLQKAGMTLHPPALYLGLAATAVPFAFAVAALIRGGWDGDALAAVRRWVAASWLFLTAGILLGMWWAYGEAEWSGSWLRDPVENAALFPWIINTLLLHSLGERGTRDELRKWNAVLLMLAFIISVYSAFVADGGIISAAHSFAQTPVGGWATGFLVFAIAGCGYLLLTRLRGLASASVIEAVAETVPVARRASKAAMPIIYAGIIVVLAALAGQRFQKEYEVTLSPGQGEELRDPFGRVWTFTSQGVSQYNELNRNVVAAAVDVARGGSTMQVVTTERRQYMNSRGMPTADPSTEVGTLGTLTQDVRVTLAGVREDESVTVRIAFNPLVTWVWLGGLAMVIGGAMLFFGPGRTDA